MEEFTADFPYMKSSCYAFYVWFIDVYLYSISFSELHFLEKAYSFTLNLASLKFNLAFSDSDQITRKEKKV